VFFMPI